MFLIVLGAKNTNASTLSCYEVDGMAIFGYRYGDWEFIGAIANEFDSDSIANEFGAGNEFKSTSIFNEFGNFGSEFSSYSAFNDFASKPPIIVNDSYKFVGYLTINEFKTPSINTYEAIACARNSFKSFSNSDLEDTVFKDIPSKASSYSSYSDSYTTPPPTNSCPANSYESDGECFCNSGYRVDSTKTYCVKNPTCSDGYMLNDDYQCVSYTQACRNLNKNDINIIGFINSNGKIDCSCTSGLTWNGNSCVATNPSPAQNTDSYVLDASSFKKSLESIPDAQTKESPPEPFNLDDSKTQNYDKTKEATLKVSGNLRECPSTTCEINRNYAETAKVVILGDYNNGEWYKVETRDDYGNSLEGWMHNSILEIIEQEDLPAKDNVIAEENVDTAPETTDKPWFIRLWKFFFGK